MLTTDGKPAPLLHTLPKDKPLLEETAEAKAKRQQRKNSDRIRSVLWGIVGATLAGTAAIAVSYIAPLVPVAAHACTALLSTVSASAGVAAATGVAVVGGAAGLVALVVAGAAAVEGALRVAELFATAVVTGCRPATMLCSAGVTLAAAYGAAVTAPPEAPQAPALKGVSAAAAFDAACEKTKVPETLIARAGTVSNPACARKP